MKKILSVLFLSILLFGCATTPVIDPNKSVDRNYFIEKYFKGKELSNVEGVWRWMSGTYEIAIIKNDTGSDTNFEYLGIVISGDRGVIVPGSAKIKLNKSANPNVYVGDYIVTDGIEWWTNGSTFLVEGDLITTAPRSVGKVTMIRMYPASKSKTASRSSKSTTKKTKASSGSAFFVDNRGHIITNHHVVKGCNNKSKIIYKNKEVEAKLIAKDDYLDLALLKADVNNDDYILLSNKSPKKLERVIAAGYQFGKFLSDDIKFTSGIISSLKGVKDDTTRIQIDAALNPGSSGGPIVYEDTGKLAGVSVSGLRKDVSEGINFGIKSSSVKGFLESNQIDISTLPERYSKKDISNLLEKTVLYTFCK